MSISDAGRALKNRISMESILDFYGYHPKHSFMCCPFHAERTPSLKVYPNSWYCFGCKRGGSVIDFVMEQEGCSFATAVQAIDSTFNLGLLKSHDPFIVDARRGFVKLLDAIADVMLEELRQTEILIEETIRARFWQVQNIEDKPKHKRTAREWDEITQSLDEMEYLEDQKQQCEELRQQIIKWRRKSIQLIHKSPVEREKANGVGGGIKP